MVVRQGEINDIVDHYLYDSQLLQSENILSRKDRGGNGKVRLEKIIFYDNDGNEIDHIICGEPCTISVIVRNLSWRKEDQIDQFTIAINDKYGNRALVMSNTFVGKEITIDYNSEHTIVNFTLDRFPINAGDYGMAFYMSDRYGNVIDWIDNITKIHVLAGDFYNSGNIIRHGLGNFLTDFVINNA
jgi:hypothetical protein